MHIFESKWRTDHITVKKSSHSLPPADAPMATDRTSFQILAPPHYHGLPDDRYSAFRPPTYTVSLAGVEVRPWAVA